MNALAAFARVVSAVNERIGRTLAWLTLGMVLVEFALVMMRYVFGLGSTIVQESVVYMHSTVFLAAAGYTLVHDGHVRCDIFYSAASARRKAIVDLVGSFLFLLPTCALIGWIAWPYVRAAWQVLEGSPEGTLGIPAVFLLKTLILVFAGLLALQGLAVAARSVLFLKGVAPAGPAEVPDREI